MDDKPVDHPEQPEADAAGSDARRFTRRQAVAGGAAFGAAVVWTSQFPFADAAIGQVIRNVEGVTGTTGPTGPPEKEEAKKTETKTETPSTGSTGTTSSTGSTGATGTTTPPFRFPQIKLASDGEMAVTVNFPAGGDFELLVTSGNSLSRIAAALKPGPHRSAFARAHAHSKGPGIVRVKAKPTAAGKTLLGRRRRAHLSTPLKATAKFTPTSGRPTTIVRPLTIKAKHS
jgi:hypothetical protein